MINATNAAFSNVTLPKHQNRGLDFFFFNFWKVIHWDTLLLIALSNSFLSMYVSSTTHTHMIFNYNPLEEQLETILLMLLSLWKQSGILFVFPIWFDTPIFLQNINASNLWLIWVMIWWRKENSLVWFFDNDFLHDGNTLLVLLTSS